MTSSRPPSFDLAIDPPPARVGPLSLSDRVGVARDLLTALKEATRSGQRHLMHRALDILHCDLIRPTLRLAAPQLVAAKAAVTDLQQEAARDAPDVALFCARATLVIDILSIS
jgi:hypothetical protein